MRPSFNTILLLLFMLFIFHSLWNLWDIFRAPTCKKGDICYKYYLNSKPKLNLHVFLSDKLDSANPKLLFNLEDFDYSSSIEKKLTLDIPKSTMNNGSLYVHYVIAPSKYTPKVISLQSVKSLPDAVYLNYKITKYLVPASKTFNLLNSTLETTNKHSSKPTTHLQNIFGLIICTDELNISRSEIPMEIYYYFRLNYNKEFLPIIMQDTMLKRLQNYQEINKDTKNVNVTFTLTPTSIGKIKFLQQIELTFHQFTELGFTEKTLDEIKGVFADTNFYLLSATIAIGSIHLLLDFLSFKNDVSFWRKKSTMAGLSTKALLWRAFSQTIIFLYLLEEETSLLVLVPCGIATLIEFWKVIKMSKLSISWKGFSFNSKIEESEAERKTRMYDDESMRYLSYVLYPLCIGSAIYSLLYQSHQSWYSWTINSLVNGVYAFGFLFMLPQLFINYRLKSVAALPWRAFTYRAFNTFIDDIFAFIISMPIAHRVACFRDDIIFIIYLYQRWLYPVDKNRTDDEDVGSVNTKKEQ